MSGLGGPAAAAGPGDGVEHVHVEAAVLNGVVASRAVLTTLLGRAPTTPAHVLTGCGLHGSLAATSTTPERVTCWACRQHAGAAHQRAAEQLRALAQMLAHSPAVEVAALTVHTAGAAHHEDLASRYLR